MAKDVSRSVKSALLLRSGDRCAKCFKRMTESQTAVDDVTPLAKIAHIRGKKFGSPRYDNNMSDEERNSYENLIVLCPTCHAIVDGQPNTYTVTELEQLKYNHENKIFQMVSDGVSNVTFIELEEVTKYIASGQAVDASTFNVIPPKDKILKNKLSTAIEGRIVMGMARVKEVQKFISLHPDIDFGERLKTGFVHEYKRQLQEGLESDALFMSLLRFASRQRQYEYAGLVVLVYLFEACEVFKK